MSPSAADRPPEEVAVGDVVEPSRTGRGTAIAGRRLRPGANESSAAAMRSASAWRSSVEPSSKNDRHCGSSGTSSSSSARSRPASAKIRFEHRRHEQDRRPHVEAEAVDLEHRGLAAEPVVLLEERRPRSPAPPACRPPPGRPGRRRSRRSAPISAAHVCLIPVLLDSHLVDQRSCHLEQIIVAPRADAVATLVCRGRPCA